MNYCTQCASYYQIAGTCNCFAQTQPYTPQPLPFGPYPWVPSQWSGPWWGIYPPTVSVPSVWTHDALPSPSTTLTTSWEEGDSVTWVDASKLDVPWSYTASGEMA